MIDDSEVETSMLENVLSHLYNVTSICSPLEVEKYLLAHSVDLILMDINMPNIGGIELCRKIKGSATTAHIPIIFITGLHRKEVEQACWEAGCSDFLVKPVFTTLLNRLSMHFQMKNRANTFQRLSLLQDKSHLIGDNWYVKFLKDQCHRANVGNTPMSLVAVQLENYDGLVANLSDNEIEEHILLVSSLLTQTLNNNVDVVIRSERNRYLCILPDSGPESARHFTFLITQALQQINRTLLTESKHPIYLKIVGITKTKEKFAPKALLDLLEESIAEPIKSDINRLFAERPCQSKKVAHRVYALAG